MKLFNKKSAATSSRGAPRLEVLSDEGGFKGLVFGMRWVSIVTGGGKEAAIKICRGAMATHFVFRGQQLGYGDLPSAANAPQQLYPAALVAARQHHGDSIFALRITPGEYWIALTRNGAPTPSDTFLGNADDATALSLVREIIQLNEDDSKFAIYTNIDNHGLDNAKPLAPVDLLQTATIDQDLLAALPRQRASIPKPVIYVAALALLVLGGQRAYKMWDAKKKAQLAALNLTPDQDPTEAWNAIIAKWEASVAAPNPDSLSLPRDSLATLPVTWDGWVLTMANCSAGAVTPAADGGAKTWACNASYVRKEIGTFNRDMVGRIPAGWNVTFTPLNKMQVSWGLVQPFGRMKIEALKPAKFHTVETVSRLQAIAPAFTQDSSFVFMALDIPAPKKPDGTAFPPDPRVLGLAQATLSVRAPLRSIDALTKAGVEADWTSISISYTAQAAQSSIRASALSAEATGVLYAKN
ncbi:MAG: type 4b pilus protein PilO2 [Longimicrobiales bacterium]